MFAFIINVFGCVCVWALRHLIGFDRIRLYFVWIVSNKHLITQMLIRESAKRTEKKGMLIAPFWLCFIAVSAGQPNACEANADNEWERISELSFSYCRCFHINQLCIQAQICYFIQFGGAKCLRCRSRAARIRCHRRFFFACLCNHMVAARRCAPVCHCMEAARRTSTPK